MVVFAKREPVGWMIASRLREWDQMSRVHETQTMVWYPNPKTTGDALVIVKLDNAAPEAGAAAR